MIRAAIVGIGTWGRNLVNSVQGKSDAIRFVAGTTRTPAKAQDYCRQQSIRLEDALEALLKESDIEALVLATPHSMHCEQIVAAAKACLDHEVTLAVGYNWRFQPALREAKRIFDIFKREFDAAYREGGIFQLTMHPHIIGYRSRVWIVEELIRYIKNHKGVWFATHADIARYAKAHAAS